MEKKFRAHGGTPIFSAEKNDQSGKTISRVFKNAYNLDKLRMRALPF